MTASDAHRAIDAVWRIESAKLIAALARLTGDVGTAEDLAQDALLVALEKWPETGVPATPGRSSALAWGGRAAGGVLGLRAAGGLPPRPGSPPGAPPRR